MRVVGLAIAVALVGCVPGAAAGTNKDFAGSWVMDPARSESAHQDVPTGPATLVIQLTNNTLTMETTRSESEGATPFHEILNFKLDGSETANVGDGGVSVTGKAHWDGGKLVVETVRNVQNSTVTTLYVHTLSPNGRDLTIDKTLTVQHGYQGINQPTTGHGKDIFTRTAR